MKRPLTLLAILTLPLAAADPAARERVFERQVAPLLASRCLECHDAAKREGKLDLSRRDAAFQGGREGPAIVPGKPEESLLWESVDFDDMPHEREPLAAAEKQLLHDWIADGAVWTLETLDPADYRYDRSAGEQWIQRLTVEEYVRSVRDTLEVDIAAEARRLLPADVRADGFSNTAYNLGVDLDHVAAFAELARLVVERLDAVDYAQRFQRGRSVEDKAMRGLIEEMGRWVMRRPLEGAEVDALRGVSTSVVAAGGGYEESVERILEAMLQSPGFLYRIEPQQPGARVSGHALATRLSYILWGSSPSRELARAAERDRLQGAEDVRWHAERMLDDERARQRALEFAEQWLNLGRLERLDPNPEHFPDWDPALAAAMREETLAFFEEVAWRRRRPLGELLNAQLSYLTPELAAHYQLPLELDGAGPRRVELDAVPSRGGLLTHGSVLTIGGDEASMVTRGLFVLNELLRGVVNDPPPCVDTTPVASRPGLTQRGAAAERVADPNCGACHGRFEPLAYGLEKFDGLGRYLERDRHGNELRDDGELLVPGTAEPIAYASSAELMDLLAGSDRVAESLTWKLVQFALGRPLTSLDAPQVDEIHARAREQGGSYRDLMLALVTSDLVLKNPPQARF